MKRKNRLTWVAAGMLRQVVLGCALAAALAPAVQSAPLKVVASFSILGDMVANVGGEDVAVTAIVGPDGDAHVFEPTPQDAKTLASAQLLFVNGLEFEAWLPRLVQASGFKGVQVVASQGITPLAFSEHDAHDADDDHEDHDHDHDHAAGDAHDHAAAHDHDDDHDHEDDHDHTAAHDHDDDHHHAHGSHDPHAWQDLSLAQRYVANIADALAQADPQHAQGYRARAQAYTAQLAALDAEVKARAARIPADARKVVTSHDAFGYFAHAYDITFLSAAGISSQAEPSAQDLARLIDRIRAEHIRAVFIENITSPRLIEQIARETGAKVGGVLYSDALSASPPANTYLGMMRWNADQILLVLER